MLIQCVQRVVQLLLIPDNHCQQLLRAHAEVCHNCMMLLIIKVIHAINRSQLCINYWVPLTSLSS